MWFHKGRHASVGEEVDGVTVIASDPPWTVTLGHLGEEYEILLFRKGNLFENAPSVKSDREFPGLRIAKDTR